MFPNFYTANVSQYPQGGGGWSVEISMSQLSGSPEGARSLTTLRMFFFLGSITMLRLYKLTLSDQAQVICNWQSFRFGVKIFGRCGLAGEGGGGLKLFSTGARTRSRRPCYLFMNSSDDSHMLGQGRTNPGSKNAMVTKFCTLAPHIWILCLRILFRDSILAPIILRWIIEFWTVCTSLS